MLAGLLILMLGTEHVVPVHAARTVKVIARILQSPNGVGVDSKGNIYILASDQSDTSQVIRQAADRADQTVLVRGLKVAASLAVDAQGDVYLVDTDHHRVLKIAPSGAQSVLAGGFANPSGVAVDGTGTVYTVDTGTNRLIAISPGGKQRVVAATLEGLSPEVGGSAYLAADSRGDIYVAEDSSSQVLRIAGGSGTATAVKTGVSVHGGIAVDGSDNLYIADSNNAIPNDKHPDPYHDRVIKRTPGGKLSTVGTGLLGPKAVAVDPAGNVYIADTQHARIVKVPAGGGTQITIGSGLTNPSGLAVDPAGNLYILDNVQTSAGLQSLSFNPNHLVRLSSSGAATTLNSSLQAAVFGGVVVDTGGNVYVADAGHNRVLKFAAGTGTATTIGGTLRYPANVAIDGAGNIYVTSVYGTHGKGDKATADLEVVRIAASGGGQRVVFKQPQIPALVAYLLGLPIATDSKGDLFISPIIDMTHGKVLELPSGKTTPVVLPIKPIAFPIGVDAHDNVYLLVQQGPHSSSVVELPAGGGAPRPVIPNLGSLGGIAVDSGGNIYTVGNGLVQEYEAFPTQG